MGRVSKEFLKLVNACEDLIAASSGHRVFTQDKRTLMMFYLRRLRAEADRMKRRKGRSPKDKAFS
jgi:hypothetical protein